jgi:hypothetical protein
MMSNIRPARLRILLLVLPLSGLAACGAPTGCDPARAGFVESLNCSNGGFQNRQVLLEQNLAASRANALEQKAAASRAGAEAHAAQRDLAARRRAISQLDSRLAAMQSQLQSAGSRPGVNQAALIRATAQLNDLGHEQKQISHDNPSETDLRMIEDRQRKILQILNDL